MPGGRGFCGDGARFLDGLIERGVGIAHPVRVWALGIRGILGLAPCGGFAFGKSRDIRANAPPEGFAWVFGAANELGRCPL